MSENTEVANAEVGSQSIALTAQEKAEWAARFLESGMSLRRFSAQHGLRWYALWRWVNRRRLLAAGEAVAAVSSPTLDFTEMKLPRCGERSDWVVELSLPNGTVVRLSPEVPVAMLEQLLRLC